MTARKLCLLVLWKLWHKDWIYSAAVSHERVELLASSDGGLPWPVQVDTQGWGQLELGQEHHVLDLLQQLTTLMAHLEDDGEVILLKFCCVLGSSWKKNARQITNNGRGYGEYSRCLVHFFVPGTSFFVILHLLCRHSSNMMYRTSSGCMIKCLQ